MAVIFIEQKPLTRYVKQMVDGVEKEVPVQTFKEEKKIISLATIQSALGSSFRITGLNGQGESSELALLLRAGGLAAPMYFAEERTIGPSLGADNIAKGIDASLWGMLFVSLFIIAINALLGFLGDALNYPMDWPFLLSLTALAVAGIFFGHKLQRKIAADRLRKGFGWLTLVTGIWILLGELLSSTDLF